MTLQDFLIKHRDKIEQNANELGCWIWTGATSNVGVPVVSLPPKQKGEPRNIILASKLTFMLVHEMDIDTRLERIINTKCNNKLCVNPLHFDYAHPEVVEMTQTGKCIKGHDLTDASIGGIKWGKLYCMVCTREERKEKTLQIYAQQIDNWVKMGIHTRESAESYVLNNTARLNKVRREQEIAAFIQKREQERSISSVTSSVEEG